MMHNHTLHNRLTMLNQWYASICNSLSRVLLHRKLANRNNYLIACFCFQVHLQLMGIQQAGVPLPSDAVEEPVFVNAKQYHGIMRRRQIRAKAESENKVVKSRKVHLN